jgi:Calx-beta domain
MSHRFLLGISCFTALSFPITALSQPNLPKVEFSRDSYLINENVGDSKVLTLIRSNGDLSKPSTVKLIIGADTTATDKIDYDSSKIVLTVEFKPGESIKTISVPIVNDNIVEEKESINFAISEVQGAQLGSQITASLEITDIDNSKLPNAIRFALVNGVIEYVNNTQQAAIDLEWNLLPLEGNTQLKKEIQANYPKSKAVTCLINNEDLTAQKWVKNLAGDLMCREYLEDAFRTKNLNNLQGNEFENFWTERSDLSNGYNRIVKSKLSKAQYFGILRDYSQIKLLLLSEGINIFLDVEGTPKPRGEFPQVFSKDIKWEIKIYRFSADDSTNFYRFTAKATVNRFKLAFPVPSSTPFKPLPQAKISIAFKGSPGLIQPNLATLPFGIELANRDTTPTLQETKTETELITTLGYFFNLKNADFGKLVNNNFLGNLQNTSIITGGLISDKAVDSLVGINTKFTDLGDVKIGGLIGIGLNNNNPLFVGPSLSYGGLTFAAGARVSSKNDTVNFDTSGLISLDLSQALGGQQPNQRNIEVGEQVGGGNWGVPSDEISKDLALVDLSISEATVATLQKGLNTQQVYLVKTKDCSKENLLPGKQAQKLVKKLDSQLLFMPRGFYQFQDINGKSFEIPGRNSITACPATGVIKLKL